MKAPPRAADRRIYTYGSSNYCASRSGPRVWLKLGGLGKPWGALKGLGTVREALGGLGKPWEALEGAGKPCEALGVRGRPGKQISGICSTKFRGLLDEISGYARRNFGVCSTKFRGLLDEISGSARRNILGCSTKCSGVLDEIARRNFGVCSTKFLCLLDEIARRNLVVLLLRHKSFYRPSKVTVWGSHWGPKTRFP
jgi:hypothetical protein